MNRIAVFLLLVLCTISTKQAFSQEEIVDVFTLDGDVPAGKSIDESYRLQFLDCDKNNTFSGVKFPIVNKKGKTIWFGCKTDPSRFTRFESLQSANGEQKAVLVESKIAHDADGSTKACSSAKGLTDQCATSLMLNPTASHPCILPAKGTKSCVPVNADTIPYIVMPMAAPKGIAAGKFHDLSGVSIGDYGVVIANGRMVSVIVADGGPAYKMGEGSTALLKRLSTNGKVKTIASGVIFVIFPRSKDPIDTLSPDTLLGTVRTKGADLYKKLTGQALEELPCLTPGVPECTP